MSVLVIGADEITPIKAVLRDLGADNVEHWDARNENRVNRRPIPAQTECVVMLTSFLNHNTMKKIKVCYAISSLCEGPTYVLHNIVRYMDYDKFEVDIITMTPEKETTLIDNFRTLPLHIHQLTTDTPLSPWSRKMA